jgi:hypothetical protein
MEVDVILEMFKLPEKEFAVKYIYYFQDGENVEVLIK